MTPGRERRLAAAVMVTVLVAWTAGPSRAADQPPESSCIKCHLLLADQLKAVAEAFKDDVHNQLRLGCPACHGGNPEAEDPTEAMNPDKGFRGKPAPLQIPEFCGNCHQNASFIKQFAPNLPTDQLSQYWTSVHGQRIKAGDANAATCVSCHGAHGILSVHDTRSPVYPTHVVDTCASCHADAKRMAPYKIPTNQVADYKESVHYRMLTVANDLSAPTCNSCHGSHGATPPGVQSVANICGTCHAQNMELFRSSPHQVAFAKLAVGACEACHSNHRVLSPKDSWLELSGDGVCVRCHKRDDRGSAAAIGMLAALQLAVRTDSDAEEQVALAKRAGMLMDQAEADLQQAHQDIITARTQVHTVSVAAVAEHTDAAVKASGQALASARAAFDEIHYRRTGLLIALALIVLALIALVLTIRQIEHPAPPSG
jgi:predicted CXXCH cytochrome family protein